MQNVAVRPPSALLISLLLLLASPVAAAPYVADEVVERVGREGRARVLVELHTASRTRSEIARAQIGLAGELSRVAPTRRKDFASIPWSAMEVDANALLALARSPRVRSVQIDRLNRPFLDGSRIIVEADLMEGAGFDGSGQTIVVIDTGIDNAHPNLAAEVVDGACFALGDPPGSGDCPGGVTTAFGLAAGLYCTFSDDCFHGTHVGNIAGGEGSQADGIAVGADLISIQVFSGMTGASECDPDPVPCPRAYDSDLIDALEYVHDTLRFSYTVAAVNMSLGGETYDDQATCDAENAAIKAAIDNLRAQQIAVVIAAGNDGLDDEISTPACISSAISVSALKKDDTIPSLSNRASFLSLWAPGKGIKSADWQTSGYRTESGTSMAAPHAAGAFALLRHAYPVSSGETVADLLAALQATGEPIPDTFADTSRIRTKAALDGLGAECRDGADNDGDTFTDVADTGCDTEFDLSELGGLKCDDGVDNDLDFLTDYPDDPQCGGPWDNSEAPQQACGLDAELALGLPCLILLRRWRRRTFAGSS